MYEAKILIDTVLDAKKFVNICNGMDFDIDIILGRYVANAKSIMGIFALDLSKPLTVKAYCDEDHEFVSKIQEFLVMDSF